MSRFRCHVNLNITSTQPNRRNCCYKPTQKQFRNITGSHKGTKKKEKRKSSKGFNPFYINPKKHVKNEIIISKWCHAGFFRLKNIEKKIILHTTVPVISRLCSMYETLPGVHSVGKAVKRESEKIHPFLRNLLLVILNSSCTVFQINPLPLHNLMLLNDIMIDDCSESSPIFLSCNLLSLLSDLTINCWPANCI